MAHGQPAPVSWSITQMAHFVSPDAGIWNFLFGALQLCIGVGMFFRKTVKPAIVVMAVWAFGVWWFGEGFGMLLTGAASPLTGAPGAVVLYPLDRAARLADGGAGGHGRRRRGAGHPLVGRRVGPAREHRAADRLVGLLDALGGVVAPPGQPGRRIDQLDPGLGVERPAVVVRPLRDLGGQRAAAQRLGGALAARRHLAGHRRRARCSAGARRPSSSRASRCRASTG